MSTATSPSLTTTAEAATRKKQLLLNLLSAAIVALLVLGAFYKTVFQGAPISRVYQLGQRDTLFSKYDTAKREGFDASVYQYFVPSHVFLGEQLRKGVVPLWNPLAGCGAPFLADVETAVFWPLRLCTLSLEPLRAWNLLIVANVLSFGLGTFLLAKLLELRRFAVIYAALICAFCPYLIFQSELIGSSASLIPLVMASFVYLQRAATFARTAMAGLACAVMILSGHPEPSFFGIVCASMLYLALSAFDRSSTAPLYLRLLRGLLQIAFIGCFAFGFCAFMLLPFLELLRHSDCYKLGLTGHRPGVPLNSILINLFHPAYANSSPYLGILCIPFALIAVWQGIRNDRNVQALTSCALISIALMSQLGPLDWLMNLKGFSWFVPKYCWPALLVMLSLLSACGFQYLVSSIQKSWRTVAIVTIAASLLTLVGLGAIRAYPELLHCIRQDEAFEQMQVINKFWTRDLILLTVFALLATLSPLLKKLQGAFLVLAVTVISVLSIAPVARIASPITGDLNYDLVEPIAFLKEQKARMVSMGRHVFCPSSNYCYGLNNIVPVNVYHPSRFQQFLIGCGVTPEGVNQFFDGRLSRLINPAALKYVVTPQPVLSDDDNLPAAAALSTKEEIGWGEDRELLLKGAALRLDPENRELRGQLQFLVAANRARDIAWQPVLLDATAKNILWLGDTERLIYQFENISNSTETIDVKKDLAVPLPKDSGVVIVGLKVFDWKNMAYLPRSSAAPGKGPNSTALQELVLGQAEISAKAVRSNIVTDCRIDTAKHVFKLQEETPTRIRVYENSKALPQAFLSRNCKIATNDKEAFALLMKPDFDSSFLVLDPSPESGIDKATLQANTDGLDSTLKGKDLVEFNRDDCNNITVKVQAAAPAILLLSENYYPGWQASIEQGKKISSVPIMHANYLFQAVKVPAGSSTIRFKFEPAGFKLGLALAIITALICLFYPAYRDFRKQKAKQDTAQS